MDLLIVEDDDIVGRVITRLAGLAGLSAHHVTTGKDALDMLASGEPVAVVLVDLHLGAQRGLSLVTDMRRRGDRRPVILMSGLPPSQQDAEELERCGVSGFLVKPIEEDQLAHAYHVAVNAGSR